MSDHESIDRHENGSNQGSFQGEGDGDGSPRGSREERRSERHRDSYRSDRGDRERRVESNEGGSRRGRSRSTSPMSSRRRHNGNREAPTTSRCLGIFGLSIYTQERDLKEVLGKYGRIEDVQIVYDAQTGRSRGFCFVYFEKEEDAMEAKEQCNGIEIDGRKIRVDFSITQRAHTPTPGIYMGKPTRESRGGRGDRYSSDDRGHGGGGGGYRGRGGDREGGGGYGGGRGSRDDGFGGGRGYRDDGYGGGRHERIDSGSSFHGGRRPHHRGGRDRSPSPYRGSRGGGYGGGGGRSHRSRSFSPRNNSAYY